MDYRERFLVCMRYESVDRPPYWWFGAWRSTLDRWHAEGLPNDVHLERHFGFDRHETLPIRFGMIPAFERVLLVPCYKQVTEVLREHSVDIAMVDSDGNIDGLIPLWLKAGVNAFYPPEVQAGMDPVAPRKEYGRRYA